MGRTAQTKTRWHRVEMPTERVIFALADYRERKTEQLVPGEGGFVSYTSVK